MNKIFFIFFIIFGLSIFANDNKNFISKKLTNQKKSQNLKDNNLVQNLNNYSEKIFNFSEQYSCEENLKELDKEIVPKAYTDCRDIRNSYCNNNSCFSGTGTCRWCKIVLPGGDTGRWGCYNP